MQALTALKYKPLHEPLPSYLQELKSRFDMGATVGYWRNQVEQLETRLKEMDYALERERENALLLTSTQENEQQLAQAGSRGLVHRAKKKKVKHSSPLFDGEAGLKPKTLLDDDGPLPLSLLEDIGILSLLYNYEVFKDKHDPQLCQRWLPALKRCIGSVEQAICSALTQPIQSSSRDVLTRVGGIMPVIIRKSLEKAGHSLSEQEKESIFVGTIAEQFLKPLIKGIGSISHVWASVQLTRESSSTLAINLDLRPVILGICKQTIDSLVADERLYRRLSSLVAICAIQQLGQEWANMQMEPTSCDMTEHQHIRYLGFKDAIWYLVALVQATIVHWPTTPDQEPPTTSAILCCMIDALSDILRQDEDKGILGSSARRLLLGVIEGAWVNGCLPPEGTKQLAIP
ncbi:hypothetical protein FS842_005604 [Serendipita sp. 407]|nr:hypothetical protein FS842_005604 [Serendipita sp. 407]